MNQRKKWCECCKIMIPFTRSAIQDHEASHKHKRNHERELRDAHNKARKEHKNISREDDYFGANSRLNNPRQNQRGKLLSKAKPEEKEEIPVADFITGTEAVDAEVIDDKEQFLNGKIWVLEREDDTQKLRFRNTLTGLLNYERPVGLILEDFEEEAWEEFQVQLKEDPIRFSKDHKIKIGDWEEVKQGEGYFDRHKVEESEESQPRSEKPNILEQIERKVADGTLQTQGEIVKELILQGTSEIGFSQRLRELAEKDVDLSIAVPQMRRAAHSPPKDTGKLFKKRVLNSKKGVRIGEDDDE